MVDYSCSDNKVVSGCMRFSIIGGRGIVLPSGNENGSSYVVMKKQVADHSSHDDESYQSCTKSGESPSYNFTREIGDCEIPGSLSLLTYDDKDTLIGTIDVDIEMNSRKDEWVQLCDGKGNCVGELHVAFEFGIKPSKTPPFSGTTNSLLTAIYIGILFMWAAPQFIPIPVPFNVVAVSVLIIFAGCHHSLVLRDREEMAEKGQEVEVIGKDDAMKFPFVGSAALFSLYLAFTFFDKATVNLVLAVYITLIGTYILTVTLVPFVAPCLRAVDRSFSLFPNRRLPVVGDIGVEFSLSDAVAGVLAATFSAVYFQTKNWAMSNIFGILFSLQAIESMSLGSYKIGAILLSGLFFYDIFWVFGTDVMVTVARSFDAPIKILFPRTLPYYAGEEMLYQEDVLDEDGAVQFAAGDVKFAVGDYVPGEFSLLGLGDIVIPGIFIAVLLRYDAHRARLPLNAPPDATFPKPFFHVCLFSYTLGLAATLAVMYFFNAAQPALLYLVPACLSSSLLTAAVRGELKELFAYTEEEEEEEEKKKKGKSKKDD